MSSATTSRDRSPAAGRISLRVGGITPSATLAVDAKAKLLVAQGRDVIGFGAGEPDFPTPQHIVAAAARACADPAMHRYSPSAGLPQLRSAIADKTARDSGYVVDAAQVLVTNGGKQAVYQALATLLNPGDEVLLPAPFWTTYPEAVRLAGGVTVAVPTTAAQGYLPTVADLEQARTPATRLVLLCSPSNPTGAVMPPELLTEIGYWALEHGLWVLADEIYEHLVYDDAEHRSLPVLVPELADRCVVVNGVAKTYAMTGWRVGWLLGPRDVVAAATALQSHATSNVANVSQAAALAAVSGDLAAVHQMRAAFDRRRLAMHAALSAMPGVTCALPHGAFYCFPDVSGVLGRPLNGRVATTSAELAELALEEADVAVVPGEAFGAPGHLRLSYALDDAGLAEGMRRLSALLART